MGRRLLRGPLAVRLTMRVTDLRLRHRMSATFHLRTDDDDWFVDVDIFSRAEVEVFLAREPDYPDPDDLDECESFAFSVAGEGCPGFAGQFRPAREVVKVVLPPQCLGNPHWVRVGSEFSGEVDDVMHYDRWGPVGSDQTGFVGPFGPQVRPSIPVSQPVGPDTRPAHDATHRVRYASTGGAFVRVS